MLCIVCMLCMVCMLCYVMLCFVLFCYVMLCMYVCMHACMYVICMSVCCNENDDHNNDNSGSYGNQNAGNNNDDDDHDNNDRNDHIRYMRYMQHAYSYSFHTVTWCFHRHPHPHTQHTDLHSYVKNWLTWSILTYIQGWTNLHSIESWTFHIMLWCPTHVSLHPCDVGPCMYGIRPADIGWSAQGPKRSERCDRLRILTTLAMRKLFSRERLSAGFF